MPLPFHIFLYIVLIPTNGTYTVSLGPKMSSPVPLFQFMVHVKYLDGTLAFQKSYHLRKVMVVKFFKYEKCCQKVKKRRTAKPQNLLLWICCFTIRDHRLEYKIKYELQWNPRNISRRTKSGNTLPCFPSSPCYSKFLLFWRQVLRCL